MSVKILVADDSRAMRRLLVHAAHAMGIDDIIEAVDGDDAVAKFDRGHFDLVLTDWNMPNRSGLEVVQAIRARDQYVPIIMVTAEDETTHALQALEAGATGYLTKPFELDALIATIQGLQLV